MDFMKVFDQTVREIKREVNLKVLKVPEIEQKVLDATDNEPWGPHGSALAEIAQATKKFSECQMVMSVLWTRLRETGKDWRYVYKSLSVIEYLVAHGSERAVDDIIEHTFQISSLSSFEYVEPSGKDMGINVRKKAETIVALLNDKDKIQEVRNKAAANRDKYFGLSSSGASYKSSSAALGGSNFESRESYKGMSISRESKGRGHYEEDKDAGGKSYGTLSGNHGGSFRSTRSSKDQDSKSSSTSKLSAKMNSSANKASSNTPSSSLDDEFDDFDPRGTATKPSTGSSKEVDLFGDSLIDFMDEPVSVDPAPPKPATNSSPADVDLFADADFVSAPATVESAENSQKQNKVDLFASKPAAAPSVDLFADSEFVAPPQTRPIEPAPPTSATPIVDPFAAVPLNNFDGSDPFGAFTSFSSTTAAPAASTGPPQSLAPEESSLGDLNVNTSTSTNPPQKKANNFQVKSGIWADSLSRGLIDLNITAPKKVSLAEVGIVGGLTDGSDEMVKGPTAPIYMGRAMGSGTGLGRSNFTTASTTQSQQASSIGGDDDFFSSLGTQPYQFNNAYKK